MIQACFTKWFPVLLSIFLAMYLIPDNILHAQTKNGFDISNASIPVNEIKQGGPPRDGIPSIDNPRFNTASQADNWLNDDDRILAIEHNGKAKAYPIRILVYHEIANDKINGKPIVVSYCPLCGTGMIFDANVAGSVKEFGVSGLLYNSDVLMYDRQTESLWSQIEMTAVSGRLKGTELKPLPMEHTTWGAWKEKHPNSLVLSRDTGFRRNYNRTPYPGYESSSRVFFPVAHQNSDYHPKEWVVGVELNGEAKAYPFKELKKANTPFDDTVGGKEITIHFDKSSNSAFVTEKDGEKIPSLMAYWFAWHTFHPNAKVFKN